MSVDLDLGDTRLILLECHDRGVLRNQAAYILATAKWETAHKMKPIREMGGDAYLRSKPYYPHVGRGYVQLTWEANYRRASEEVGEDLIADPDKAMDPYIAAEILVVGMMQGWFCLGHKLGNYCTLQKSDFLGARRVVNGTDRKREIADIARAYDAALLAEGYGVDPALGAKPSNTETKDMEKGLVQFLGRMGLFGFSTASLGALVAGAFPGVEWTMMNGAEGWFVSADSVWDAIEKLLALSGVPFIGWLALWRDARKKGKMR